MNRLLDIKPKSGLIIDSRPTAGGFAETKPKMQSIFGETEVYFDTSCLDKGQAIGLLLALTYSEDIDIIVVRP